MTIELAIVTPVYPPAPGGGAYYTQTLSSQLVKSENVSRLTVYTEKHPNRSGENDIKHPNFTLRDVFPFRAGRAKRDLLSYIQYAAQQIHLLLLPLWLPKTTTHLLVHSSFHINPNLLSAGLRLLKRQRGSSLTLIADIRDPLMTQNKFDELEIYDKIVCCSLAIQNGLKADENLFCKSHHIPIIFEQKKPPTGLSESLVQKHKLNGLQIAFSANGLNKAKAIDEIIEIVREVRKTRDVVLVVAGRGRDRDHLIENAISDGTMVYVGMQTNEEVLAWLDAASIHLNVSSVEGLPRGSLEAIAAGTPVLLPNNILEFQQHCSDYILSSEDTVEAAKQVVRIIDDLGPCDSYPVKDHSLEHVSQKYVKLLKAPSHP